MTEYRRLRPAFVLLHVTLGLMLGIGGATTAWDASGPHAVHTAAGDELRPNVDSLGRWARKWVTRDYGSYELDPAVLMWSLRRYVLSGPFPPGRTVLQLARRFEGLLQFEGSGSFTGGAPSISPGAGSELGTEEFESVDLV